MCVGVGVGGGGCVYGGGGGLESVLFIGKFLFGE